MKDFRALTLPFFALLAFMIFGSQKAEAANNCNVATGAAAHNLCWLDFGGYPGAVGVGRAMTWTLPEGSTLSATVTNLGSATLGVTSVPTSTGSALGRSAYTGTGISTVYGPGSISVQLSNIKVTGSRGVIPPTVTIAAADAETTDTRDGAGANLTWLTGGTAWSQYQIMNAVGGGSSPICTMVGLGTATAVCTPTQSGNSAAYVLSTAVTQTQNITLSTTSSASQGFAFGVELAQVQLITQITNGRRGAGDQFSAGIFDPSGSETFGSAATSGTGLTSNTGLQTVVAGDPYLFQEISYQYAVSGYQNTYSCTSGQSGVPTGDNASVTQFNVTPPPDAQTICTEIFAYPSYTETALTPVKNVSPGQVVTDLFQVTNTSPVIETIHITASTYANPTANVQPSGFTLLGVTYTTIAALNAYLAANPIAPNATLVIGAVYTVTAPAGEVVTVNFFAQAHSGNGTASNSTDNTHNSDTIAAPLAVSETATAQTSPGGAIEYSIVVTAGSADASGTAFTDNLPAGVTSVGTPTCTASGGSGQSCGTVSVAGSTITSTIAALPANASVTFTFAGYAASAGTYTNTAQTQTPQLVQTNASGTTYVSQANSIVKTVRNVTQGQATGTTANTAASGDTIEYALTFSNTTGAAIKNPTILDPLPAGVTFVSASIAAAPGTITSGSASAAVPTGGTTHWYLFGYVASGAAITVKETVTVN